jgi:hypothetical protein
MDSPPTFERWHGTSSGGIQTTLSPDRTVVRLTGDIDLAMAEEFGRLLLSLPTATREIVLDVGDLTFADSTLVNFVAVMHEQLTIAVAPSNRWVVELQRLVGLVDKVASSTTRSETGLAPKTTAWGPACTSPRGDVTTPTLLEATRGPPRRRRAAPRSQPPPKIASAAYISRVVAYGSTLSCSDRLTPLPSAAARPLDGGISAAFTVPKYDTAGLFAVDPQSPHEPMCQVSVAPRTGPGQAPGFRHGRSPPMSHHPRMPR